jgi:hypothetical protein
MTETRPCLTCKGEKILVSKAFTSLEGKHYPERRSQCYACRGAGEFMAPDIEAILAAIKGKKGLRSSRPVDKRDAPGSARPYYVWRMARFHGGADVTMPMCASMDVGGDPFRVELDAIADSVARRVYGSDLAAAHRWGRAFGYLDRDMPGLPSSAYSGGMVHDGNKPDEEAAELI